MAMPRAAQPPPGLLLLPLSQLPHGAAASKSCSCSLNISTNWARTVKVVLAGAAAMEANSCLQVVVVGGGGCNASARRQPVLGPHTSVCALLQDSSRGRQQAPTHT
jgi:hypothetical protein